MELALVQIPVAVNSILPGEGCLQNAFASFTEAAAALETSYRQLQIEVGRLRQELERKNHDLEQTRQTLRRKQALAEISAMLAHEIRNPLGSMELLTALLEDSSLDAKSREWTDQLRAGVRMLSATVNNVLQFYSPSQQELLPVELGETINLAEKFLRPLADQSGVQVQLSHALDGVFVSADKHGLQQVLLNLALNAFRAMPAGGTLTIQGRLSPAKNRALIDVADAGCGISPQHLISIFEANFTTRKSSPGIGLTVCQEIMARHGGRISVSSRVGEGSTFTLELPVLRGGER
jgi:signal transduction histidine kinase